MIDGRRSRKSHGEHVVVGVVGRHRERSGELRTFRSNRELARVYRVLGRDQDGERAGRRDEGILSMSLNPDTVVDTWQRLADTKVAA